MSAKPIKPRKMYLPPNKATGEGAQLIYPVKCKVPTDRPVLVIDLSPESVEALQRDYGRPTKLALKYIDTAIKSGEMPEWEGKLSGYQEYVAGICVAATLSALGIRATKGRK